MKPSTLAGSLAALFIIGAPLHVDARDKGKGKGAPATRELAAGSCSDSDGAALWWSPVAPAIGQPLKIMAVGDGAGELALTDPKGAERVLATVRHDGPPSSMTADFTPIAAGNHQLIWKRGGKAIACRKVPVAAKPPAPATSAMSVGPNVWATLHTWDHRYENFYSAWIATLFDAPSDQSLDFRPLHQALRDPARNFLYGYLGLREDDAKNKAAIKATPDCRPAVFPARVLLVEARASIRLPRLRSRQRIAPAALHDVLQQRRRAEREGHAGGGEVVLPPARQPRAVR